MSQVQSNHEDDHLVFSTVRVAAGGEWSSPPHGWRFVLIRQGTAVCHADNGPETLEAGDVLVLRAATNGHLRARAPGDVEACYFRFHPEQLVGLLTLSERRALESVAGQRTGVRVFRTQTSFAKQFSDAASRPRHPGTLSHRCLVLQIVASLLGEHSTPAGHQPSENAQAQDRVKDVVAHLSESQLQNLSVEGLARRCGCSRRHLNRLLRSQFGCSFLALKMELRLEKAAVLLRNSNDKIINIAMECGFNHLGLFSARFRRRFGASPSEWRQKALGFESAAPGAARAMRLPGFAALWSPPPEPTDFVAPPSPAHTTFQRVP